MSCIAFISRKESSEKVVRHMDFYYALSSLIQRVAIITPYVVVKGIVYVWDIFEGRDHTIPLGRTEFDTSPNMKMVGLMI